MGPHGPGLHHATHPTVDWMFNRMPPGASRFSHLHGVPFMKRMFRIGFTPTPAAWLGALALTLGARLWVRRQRGVSA